MHDDKGDEEPQDRRESVEFWLRWIKAAKKAAKDHWTDARDAYAEYENKAGNETAQMAGSSDRASGDKTYPIYWSSCKTIQPAYYARTPEVVTRRLFDIDDPVATTASLIMERLAKHLVENCNFDDVMVAVVQDFIHADKATAQVIYEADVTTEVQRLEAIPVQTEQGLQYVDAQGNPIQSEVSQDEQGYYYQSPIDRAANKKIKVSPARYNRILHTPEATSEDEITDKAFYFCLDYDDACRKFPDLDPKDLPWKTNKAYKDGDDDAPERADTPGRFLEGWECWSLKTKRVYYVCEAYTEDFLKAPEPDKYGLRKYFPAPPFAIGSRPSDNLYPTPAYVQIKPTIELLHKCYGRVMSLVESIRRRAIVDEAQVELVSALQDLDGGEFITAKNMQSIVEKGGLQNLVMYLPVQELVAAIGELAGLEDRFKNNLYEWFGVPDILRGATDPIETAAAQEIKQGSAHDRFKYDKRQIQRLARDLIEQMLDLALGVYEDDEIAEIVGAQFMQPQDQQNFSPALEMARSDQARLIRVEIETDSTSFIDEQLENQQRQAVGQLIIGGLDKIAAIATTTPDFVPIALRTLLYGISGMRGGKDFEDDVVGAVNTLVQKTSQPPPGPPPPDPIEQMKQQIAMQELQLKQKQIGVEMQKVGQKDAESQRNAALEARIQSFQEWFQTEKMNIERVKIGLDEREKFVEEQRLSQKTAVEAAKNSAPRAVTINLSGGAKAPKIEGETPEIPKKRRITPVRDVNGNAIAYDYEEIPSV